MTFNAEEFLNKVAKDYFERQIDCCDEIIEYIMEVEPNKKTSEQIRDEIYSIIRKHGLRR